ncbi:MAG: HAD-IC family P-type ATPase, partial [Actinomycetota bacterium]
TGALAPPRPAPRAGSHTPATLPAGRMTLAAVAAPEVGTAGSSTDQVLRLAGAAEADSEHPIGRAVTAAALRRLGSLPTATGVEAITGHGIHAIVDGRSVWVGRRELMAKHGLSLPPAAEGAAADAEQLGRTAVFVGRDDAVVGVLTAADTIKPGAADTVDQLRHMGLSVTMLTGDNERTAASIGAAAGVDRVIASVLPEQKQAEIARLQASGEVVAMVGDGVNDAPALVQADLGVALGTGTDVAIESGDLTLMSGDVAGVVTAIDLSRRTHGTIRQNLFWAFAYNVAAIPLAAAGFLSPMVAGAAMACSSVSVVANSLRLRRVGDRAPSLYASAHTTSEVAP